MDALEEHLAIILDEVAIARGITDYELILDLNPLIGNGFVGQIYMEKLKNTANGEVMDVVIKKTPPKRNDLGAMFTNEHVFYSEIYPALNRFQTQHSIPNPFKNIPLFFCGSSTVGKEYIAMENLKPKGFLMHDKISHLNCEQLKHIFQVYGRFHALSFLFEKNDPEQYREIVKKIQPIFEMYDKKDVADSIKNSFSDAVNALDKQTDADLFEQSERLIKDIGDYFLKVAMYDGKYGCMNHGDCWSNNILFMYKPSAEIETIKLIDFQLCRHTTPVHDLSYLLFSGGSKEDFRNFQKYLQIYHNSFLEFTSAFGCKGEDILPFNDLIVEWKENALFGILMAIYVWQYKLYPEDKVVEILRDYHMTADEKHEKWVKLKKQVNESDIFKRETRILLNQLIKGDLLHRFRSKSVTSF